VSCKGASEEHPLQTGAKGRTRGGVIGVMHGMIELGDSNEYAARPFQGFFRNHQSVTIKKVPLLRRLFSTFAPGWPGVGLLLLRFVAGFATIFHGITKLETGLPLTATLLQALGILAAILLVAGLWTPVSGSLVAALELWNLISAKPADPLPNILMASIGAALALVGPGAWSVDARLFGWKRIDVGNPRS
jgi:uncharacterized membrane protein YphA (DoxX/SURF4 family)